MSANSPITLREIVTYEKNNNRNKSGRRRETSDVLFNMCQEYGHMSKICTKIGVREKTFAPGLSLNNQYWGYLLDAWALTAFFKTF